MTYDKEQASGNMLSEITFDRIIFMNSWALNGASASVDVQLFYKNYGFNIFFLTLTGA